MLSPPRSRWENVRRSEVRPWIARGTRCGTVVVRQVAQARRAVGEDGLEGAIARQQLPVLPLVNIRSFFGSSHRTIEATRRTHNGLDDAQDALEPLPDISVLRLDRLFLAEDDLQVMVWLLALQIPDALIEAIDLVLCPLPDGTLSFAVVCALSSKLFRRKVGNATRVGASPALFVGLTIARTIVSRGSFGRVCLRRRRHADHGCVWAATQEGNGQILPRVMTLTLQLR